MSSRPAAHGVGLVSGSGVGCVGTGVDSDAVVVGVEGSSCGPSAGALGTSMIGGGFSGCGPGVRTAPVPGGLETPGAGTTCGTGTFGIGFAGGGV
jgi:hypothetical protein